MDTCLDDEYSNVYVSDPVRRRVVTEAMIKVPCWKLGVTRNNVQIMMMVNVLVVVVETLGKRTRMPDPLPPRGRAQEIAPIDHPLLPERTEVTLVT
jgi:hypothetical protein